MQESTEVLAILSPDVTESTGRELTRRQPRVLILMTAVAGLATFSWSGAAAILPVHLVAGRGMAEGAALGLAGAFAAVMGLAPLFGGWVADRQLGARRGALVGAAMLALGGGVLAATSALPSATPLLAGAALVALGAGLFQPALLALVGESYQEGDRSRDSGFTFLYGGIRAGGLLGIPLAGGISVTLGWAEGFGAAGLAGLVAVMLLLRARRSALRNAGEPPDARARMIEILMKLGLGAVVLVAGQFVVSRVAQAFGRTEGLVVLGVLVLVVGLWLADSPLTQGEKRRAAVLGIAGVFVVAFWTMFDRTGVAIEVFTEAGPAPFSRDWTVPAIGVAAVLFAPLLAWIWMRLGRQDSEPGTLTKIAFGLILLGIASATLYVAGAEADAGRSYALWLPVAGVAILGVGEVSLVPAGFSLVTRLAPARLAALAMGAWLVARSAGAQLAGLLGLIMPEGQGLAARPAFAVPSWSNFFLLFVGAATAAGLFLIVLAPFLRRAMRVRG